MTHLNKLFELLDDVLVPSFCHDLMQRTPVDLHYGTVTETFGRAYL